MYKYWPVSGLQTNLFLAQRQTQLNTKTSSIRGLGVNDKQFFDFIFVLISNENITVFEKFERLTHTNNKQFLGITFLRKRKKDKKKLKKKKKKDSKGQQLPVTV